MGFSEAELAIISQNPIEDDLDAIRRRILNKPLDERLADSLVFILASLDVASELKLSMNEALRKTHSSASETLSDALSKVHDSLSTGAVRPEMLSTVAEAVGLRKPDVEIISATMTLVSQLASDGRIELKQTSMSVTTDGVPTLVSAYSVPGIALIKDHAEQRLLNELWFSSHRNVTGFIKKYMDTTTWEPERLDKKMRIHENLVTLPTDTTHASIQEWLDRARIVGSRYHLRNTTHQNELNEPDTVFLPDRGAEKIHMDEVVVIGELKEYIQDFKVVFLQLARYVHSLFGAQPNRRFVHAFTLQGTTMELWVFDRSGAYSSELFDFKTHLDTFAGALAFYATMSPEEAGFEPEIVPLSVRPPPPPLSDHLKSSIGSIELQRPDLAGTITVFLRNRLHVHQSIASRATVSYSALGISGNDDKMEGVVKFAWVSTNPEVEAQFLLQAEGIDNVCELKGSKKIISTNELRKDLIFSHRTLNRFHLSSKTDRLRGFNCSAKSVVGGDKYGWFDERTLVCLFVSPRGSSIDSCKTPRDMVTVIRDGIVGHRALCEKLILHRDISSGNLLYNFEESGIRGFLIDLDHAKALKPNWKTKTPSYGEQRTPHLTGTVMFMSLGVLKGHDHTFRHDVESFWWLLLYLLLYKSKCFYRKTHSNVGKIAAALTKWETGRSSHDLAQNKTYVAVEDGLKEVFGLLHPALRRLEWLKELCFGLRLALFGVSVNIETPANADLFYDRILRLFNNALDKAPPR